MYPDQARLPFVDLARGFAIVAMLASHVGVFLLAPTLDPGRHILVYLTLTVAAPLFLFLVGFSLALSHRAVRDGRVRRREWMRSRAIRGLGLIVLGWLMNVVVAPGGAIITGGILQTIGLSILVLAPFPPYLRQRLARDLLALAALLVYVAFLLAGQSVHGWLEGSPVLAALLFDGFPPWPWIAMVMLGMSIGAAWLYAGGEDDERALLRRMQWTGLALILTYFVIGSFADGPVQLHVSRDYIINGHWLPNYVTALWVIGSSLLLICVFRHLGGVLCRHVPWLATLGGSALTAYVAHLLIICLLARDLLDLVIDTWTGYLATTLWILLALIMLTGVRTAARTRRNVQH